MNSYMNYSCLSLTFPQRINFTMTVVLEKPSTFGQHTFPSLVPLHSILKIFTLVLAKGFERSTTAAGSTTSSDLRLSFIFFMGSVSCSWLCVFVSGAPSPYWLSVFTYTTFQPFLRRSGHVPSPSLHNINIYICPSRRYLLFFFHISLCHLVLVPFRGFQFLCWNRISRGTRLITSGGVSPGHCCCHCRCQVIVEALWNKSWMTKSCGAFVQNSNRQDEECRTL